MTDLASRATETNTPDKLIAGDTSRIVTKKVTLKSGQNCVRGTVLGIVAGAVTTAAGAGNTGTGDFAATPTVAAGVKAGVYRLVCIEPAANAGQFVLEDPDGVIVGRVTVASAFAGGHLAFTLADATDFVSGDFFTITVAAGTKYIKAASAAADGSHLAEVILVDDTDASGGDTECMVYETGRFNSNALTFGTGITAANVRERFRGKGIYLVTGQEV